MERVEVASERVVLAVEGDRAAYEPEEVVHGDEMAHLLAGDSQERPLPGAHFVLVLLGNVLGSFQGVGRVQVLHHEGVLYLGADMQQEHRLVVRSKMRFVGG